MTKPVYERIVDLFEAEGIDTSFGICPQALGCHGEFVEKEEDIAAAVEWGFASGKPAVIHVVLDPDANANGSPRVGGVPVLALRTGMWTEQALTGTE